MNRRYMTLLITALVLIALYACGGIYFNNFMRLRVLVNLFGDNAFTGITAVGMTFVIISGGIDLSVASVIAFTTIFIAQNVQNGMHPIPAMFLALVLGALFGAVQGWIISFFQLPPFLVTLAGMFFARGVGFIVNDVSIAIKHAFYSETIRNLAIPLQGKVRLPFTATCLIIFVILGTILARYTRFGRYVYAIGSNEASARLMGVPVDRMKVAIYALSGFCAASAGIVVTFYMQSGNSSSFTGLEMDAIAAAVIGGTLLTGGVGGVPGTLMGVLILGLIQT
ncbi:MAG: sugar ABC transporter permease YjfF, partial [Planctomycetes bacterium]|nr:sugar ABC transporter permease YjfF [Planctomycetota bacterium]